MIIIDESLRRLLRLPLSRLLPRLLRRHDDGQRIQHPEARPHQRGDAADPEQELDIQLVGQADIPPSVVPNRDHGDDHRDESLEQADADHRDDPHVSRLVQAEVHEEGCHNGRDDRCDVMGLDEAKQFHCELHFAFRLNHYFMKLSIIKLVKFSITLHIIISVHCDRVEQASILLG